MAVVDSFYGVRRSPSPLFLNAYLGAFFDERESAARAAMKRALEDAGVDDDRLLALEADLRQQAAKLREAGIRAKSGDFQAVTDASRSMWSAMGQLGSTAMRTKTDASIATLKSRADVAQALDKIAADNKAAMAYDGEQRTALRNGVNDFKASGRSASNPNDVQAAIDAVEGQLRAEHVDGLTNDPKHDKMVSDAVAYARQTGQNDLADALSKHYFSTTDDRGFMQSTHGDMTQKERDDYLRTFRAGAPGEDPILGFLRAKLMSSGPDAYGTRSEVSGEVSPTGDGLGGAPGSRPGFRVKGDPRMVGRAMSVLNDPNAAPGDYDAAVQAGLDEIQGQIDDIEARRRAARVRPAFTGANYLIDNPNFIVDKAPLDNLARVGRRAPEVQGEEEIYWRRHPTTAGAQRARERDEFDPERRATTLDAVAMGHGGNAGVYALVADTLRTSGVDAAREALAALPPDYRGAADRLVDLAKTNPEEAQAGLDKLADTDPVTFRQAYAREFRAASKDPTRLPGLAEQLGSLAGDNLGGPWADAARRSIKPGARLDEVRGALGQYADAMEAGDATSARYADEDARARFATKPTPAQERETTAAGKAAAEKREKSEKDSRDEALGAKAADATYRAWRADPAMADAIGMKIDEIPESTPFSRGMKTRLRTLSGAGVTVPPASPWGDIAPTPEQSDLRTPDPKVREEYLRIGVPDDVPAPSDDEDVDDAAVQALIDKKKGAK